MPQQVLLSTFVKLFWLTVSNLQGGTTFTDVTLISEDGQPLEAHKVILTASSPFFREYFEEKQAQ